MKTEPIVTRCDLYAWFVFVVSRPKRFTLKGFKRYWFVCKDLHLFAFKTRNDSGTGATHEIPLRGCEVTPDVNLSQDKFGIRLEVPGPDGMSEMWIRCDSVNALFQTEFALEFNYFLVHSLKFCYHYFDYCSVCCHIGITSWI